MEKRKEQMELQKHSSVVRVLAVHPKALGLSLSAPPLKRNPGSQSDGFLLLQELGVSSLKAKWLVR